MLSTEEKLEIALKALNAIQYPVKYLQEKAKEDGAELNGYMAVQLSESHSFLKELAVRAINKIQS